VSASIFPTRVKTRACSLISSTISLSTRDGDTGSRGTGIEFVDDTLLPGWYLQIINIFITRINNYSSEPPFLKFYLNMVHQVPSPKSSSLIHKCSSQYFPYLTPYRTNTIFGLMIVWLGLVCHSIFPN
jgi:hypothetical protein